jgi:hypothetical protein
MEMLLDMVNQNVQEAFKMGVKEGAEGRREK